MARRGAQAHEDRSSSAWFHRPRTWSTPRDHTLWTNLWTSAVRWLFGSVVLAIFMALGVTYGFIRAVIGMAIIAHDAGDYAAGCFAAPEPVRIR